MIAFSGRRWEVVGALPTEEPDVVAIAQAYAAGTSGGRPKAGTDGTDVAPGGGAHVGPPPASAGVHPLD